MTEEERLFLTKCLAEARQAFHDLNMGNATRTIRDSNGEMVEYQSTSTAKLSQYINSLKRQLGLPTDSEGPLRPCL